MGETDWRKNEPDGECIAKLSVFRREPAEEDRDGLGKRKFRAESLEQGKPRAEKAVCASGTE